MEIFGNKRSTYTALPSILSKTIPRQETAKTQNFVALKSFLNLITLTFLDKCPDKRKVTKSSVKTISANYFASTSAENHILKKIQKPADQNLLKPIDQNVHHRGEAGLPKHLREHDQKAALSSEIIKSRNKPSVSKNSATCRIRIGDLLQSKDFESHALSTLAMQA